MKSLRTLFLLGFFSLLVSCGREANRPASEAPASLQRVTTAQVVLQEVVQSHQANGVVRAKNSVTLAARGMGYIRELRVGEGDRVRAGQILAAIDERDAELAVQQAEAGVREVTSSRAEADAAITAAQAQLGVSASSYRRIRDLFAKKAATQQEFEESEARYKAAESQLQMAEARRRQLEDRRDQANAALNSARLTKSYASITAPFSGLVSVKHLDAGALASPGLPIFTLEREGAFELQASVEESKLGFLRVSSGVEIELEGVASPISAKVSEIMPSIEPASRSGVVKVVLPRIPHLRSGQFGTMRFEGGTQEQLSVPASALLKQGQMNYVFVVEAKTARLRIVNVGTRQQDRVEILSGVEANEQVVSPVPAGLRDAGPIEVVLR